MAMKKKYQIRNILIPAQEEQNIRLQIKKKISTNDFNVVEMVRKSIDARQKRNLVFNYTILIETSAKLFISNEISEWKTPLPHVTPHIFFNEPHPFIIGAGPAGLFAALELVEKGYSPYLFEMGDEIDKRAQKVNHFWRTGELDEKSNVQFGEGGAGTFSDGKLTARNRDFYSSKVFDYLIRFGAPTAIRYEALPHLGTDGVREIILNIRNYLIEKGCKFHFRHQLENLEIRNEKIVNITINGLQYQPEAVFLALGNSSRSTFSMLEKKIHLEAKPFAVGFRIEHPQSFINDAIWGKNQNIELLGNASYRLTHKHNERGIYSFCMCPGGFVIAASSSAGEVVTNGMSLSARNHVFANSAIVATVDKRDFGNQTLGGMNFQKKIETKAFRQENPYAAPIQSALHFAKNHVESKVIENSYRPHIFAANLEDFFPSEISASLKQGLLTFDKKIPGFIKNGVLIAPETRTSSPVRIVRHPTLFHAINVTNLFPIGEGSGYAGGIISSAADGVKAASVIKELDKSNQ
jgi:uncharacterized FAD-dependent dehydrogenase